MSAGYRAQVDTLRKEMGLDTTALWDSTVSAADRNKVAAGKVEQYFDGLVSGKSRLRPLPSALAMVLRDRSSYRLHDAGLKRAVELGEAERAKTDTSKAKGPLQPAPGPAPIPGVTPPKPGAAAPQQPGAAAPQQPGKAPAAPPPANPQR